MKLTNEQVNGGDKDDRAGTSVRQLARQLEVTEGVLRYRLKKLEEEGRRPRTGERIRRRPSTVEEAVRAIQERLEDERLTGEAGRIECARIYDVLVRDASTVAATRR